MRTKLAITLSVLMLSLAAASAPAANLGWYVGAEVGVPFGFGSFTSFGHDMTHAGYGAGLYGGYRFNQVLAAEISAKWGRTTLSAHGCCADSGYWLGSDGVRYFAPVFGMPGWNYADLMSCVDLQRYGARLNVNLLGFSESTRQGRWTLDLSPAVYAVGTRVALCTIADGCDVLEYDAEWHFGYGARLQAGYAITRNLNAGIYSEFTALTGSRLDGITEICHDDNFIWESGVRIGWNFGKCGRGKSSGTHGETAASEVQQAASEVQQPASHEEQAVDPMPEEVVVMPSDTLAEDSAVPVLQDSSASIQPEIPEPHPAITDTAAVTFPEVYFAFDSHSVAESEYPKLQEILDILDSRPEMCVTLVGWCDKYGSTGINRYISLKRAEAVKLWLVDSGIDSARITTIGMGGDMEADSNMKARRVVIEKQ